VVELLWEHAMAFECERDAPKDYAIATTVVTPDRQKVTRMLKLGVFILWLHQMVLSI